MSCGCSRCSQSLIESGSSLCSPCDGVSSSSSGCGCGSGCTSIPSSCCGSTSNQFATPYYTGARVCPEDNTQKVVILRNSQSFKSVTSSAMPACGASVSITFENVVGVVTGSWMWVPGVGYFEVMGYNPNSQEITLKNPCPAQCGTQAAAGTAIPSCTSFIVTPPPCPNSGSGPTTTFPYLAVSFTAQNSGDCIPITVTNVNGLAVGKNISINGGTYLLQSVDSATVITICNEGSGLTPGTAVEATDSVGNLIVPIILIDANPCTNTEQLSAVPLGCVAGTAYPLVGSETGQVLVWDDVAGAADFRTIGIPTLDCTVLTVTLTLDPANPPGTSYLVIVADTSAYTPTELVTIAGTQFTVDSITDSTHMHITPVVDPVVVQIYNAGTTLCSADCCTQIQAELDTKITDFAVFTPVMSINGTGVISAITTHQANYSRLGPWLMFKYSVSFTLASAGLGSGSTQIDISGLPVGAVETLDLYTCHLDNAGAIVSTGLWRINAGVLEVFKPANAEHTNGAARIDIDGKYIG